MLKEVACFVECRRCFSLLSFLFPRRLVQRLSVILQGVLAGHFVDAVPQFICLANLSAAFFYRRTGLDFREPHRVGTWWR